MWKIGWGKCTKKFGERKRGIYYGITCATLHSMGNLEHKGYYLRHNSFWTKNRTPGLDEYEAVGISHCF